MSEYLTVEQINQRMEALAANDEYAPFIEVITLGQNTSGGRSVKGLRIGDRGSANTRIPVLIIGGIHAREWAPPDALVEFMERLAPCFINNQAFVDPRFVMNNPKVDPNDIDHPTRIVFDETFPGLFSAGDVQRVFQRLDLYIFPTVNPDGRKFSQEPGNIPNTLDGNANPAPKKWWRKNRRNLGTCSDGSDAIGVDLNRNFSPTPAWDFRKYYNSAALNNGNLSITDQKASSRNIQTDFFSVFKGEAIPEKETQNIIDFVNQKRIKYYLDVHAFAREIYYPWGVNKNQTTDKFQSQYNDTWDNVASNPVNQQGRPFNSATLANSYEEYFPNDAPHYLLNKHNDLAFSMSAFIQIASGSDPHARVRSQYQPMQSFSTYSSPGDSCDYVFSTQLEVDPASFPNGHRPRLKQGVFPVISLTAEFGQQSDGFFWPSKASSSNEYLKVRREIHFGIVAFLKYAANFGNLQPPPQPPASSDSDNDGCVPTILALIGLFAALSCCVVLLCKS